MISKNKVDTNTLKCVNDVRIRLKVNVKLLVEVILRSQDKLYFIGSIRNFSKLSPARSLRLHAADPTAGTAHTSL